jgi:hypothetical protein
MGPGRSRPVASIPAERLACAPSRPLALAANAILPRVEIDDETGAVLGGQMGAREHQAGLRI